MPSAMSTPDSTKPNRRRRMTSPPLSPFSLSVPSPPVPIPTNGHLGPSSPSPANYTFSPNVPISAFSSNSSSEPGELPNDGQLNTNELDQWKFPDLAEIDEFGNHLPDEPLDSFGNECQGIFSFEMGCPIPDLGPMTANVPREQVFPADQLAEALRQFSIDRFQSNTYANAYENGINVSIDNLDWSPSQSVANLPHMRASRGNVAALPPSCPLCMLPMPIAIPPMPNVPIYTITFVNPAHQSIFLLTSPPPAYNMPQPAGDIDAGIYIYLSSTDMYLHTHAGPLPEYLPGYAGSTRVGRLRGDQDEAIWLETGAGGLGQDWLRTFWDMCRNMRMPRDSPDWRAAFDERDWVASVMATTKRNGIVVA